MQLEMMEEAVAATVAEASNAPRSIDAPPVARSNSAVTQVTNLFFFLIETEK